MKAALLAGLLVTQEAACSARHTSPQKTEPVKVALQTTPAPAASPAASRVAAPAANAASCVGGTPSALNAAAIKVGPAPLALSAGPGLWLADETSALLSATPDASWSEGELTWAGPNRVTRAVTLARVPKALRAWLGRPVRVLGANGAVCETRLQRFLVRAQITPDARTAEHWEGCADGPAVPAGTIAKDIWRLSASAGRSLIAEFSASCKGALLAVDPDLPMPAIAAPEPASAEDGASAISAFRQLPEYAQIQARFQTEQPDASGSWDDREARRGISSLTLPGRAPLYVVSVEVGTGCTGFSASLSALWAGAGPAVAVAAIDDRRLSPSAIVDLDGAGNVLLGPDGPLAARSVLRPRRSGPNAEKIDVTRYERVFLLSAPFFPGPC